MEAKSVGVVVAEPEGVSPADPATLADPAGAAAGQPVIPYQSGADAAREAAATAGNLSLKQRAVRSSAWTMTAYAVGQVIRFGSVYVLSRLLLPEDFGVVNLVSFFVTLMAALSDVGIEQAVIQHPRGDDERFLNTAWTLHAVRGVVLWVMTCAIAFPVYWIYRGQPEARYLLWMLPVAGTQPLIAGFNSSAVFTLRRHLNLGKLTVYNLGYQVVNVAVSIAIAWKWHSAWAFIVGGVVSNAFFLVASFFLIPGHSNRFCWDRTVAREIMHFGKWIVVSTLITYTAMQIDRPLISRLLDFRWAGLYGIALSLVMLPREVISQLTSAIMFPALARAAEQDPADLPRVLRRARSLILAVCLAGTLGVVLCSPLVILVFKPAYHQAGWLAQLASIGGWVILLQMSADRALLARGKTRPLATSNAMNLAVTVVGAFGGRWIEMQFLGHPDGIVGFMLGLAAGKLAGHLMIQVEMARLGMSIVRQDVLYSAALLGASLLGIVLPRWLPWYGPGRVVACEAAVALTICTVVCGWAGWRVLKGIR